MKLYCWDWIWLHNFSLFFSKMYLKLRATSMLVTDVGDEMGSWQFQDVGHLRGFGHFGHQHPLSLNISVGGQHPKDVTKVLIRSHCHLRSHCHQHDCNVKVFWLKILGLKFRIIFWKFIVTDILQTVFANKLFQKKIPRKMISKNQP